MQQVLASNSDLIFVWHENSGQTFPEHNHQIKTTINSNGFNVDIADNAIIAEPLVLLISSAKNNKCHNTINIGINSQVQVIEYITSDDTDSNNTTAAIINCASGSQLNHCILLHSKQDSSITQQTITNINQSKDTKVYSNIFAFGAGLNRVELAIALQGHNAICETACLAFTCDTETQDILLKIDHLVPHCTSNSVVRGVLKDKSIMDFVGKIVVHQDAKKTLADLQIKNILCSPKAQANNKPELEIYNDDVRCSHGSSTGHVNEDALFYMRSRGIDAPTAMAILIDGFIQPAITSCTIPMIAEFVKGIINER